MIINKTVFPIGPRNLSFLRYNNLTTVEDAEVISFNFNTFIYETSDKEIEEFIQLNKIIYIDNTYEVLETPVLEKLNRLSKIDSIYCYYIPAKDTDLKLLSKLKKRGLKCFPKQYFIDYAKFYTPHYRKRRDGVRVPMPKKSYNCLTGKVNPTRTFLIALLSKYKLLQYGYVSYFGENHTEYNQSNNNINDFNNAAYLSSRAKKIIRKELKQIKLPIVADANLFGDTLSHTKDFNAELYDAVDFVVVPETYGCTNNDNFFPTEKTIKCILMNKKFIVVGNQYFLKNLKKYYDTYHQYDISHLTDWCDTSYDALPTLEERIIQVVNIVKDNIRIKK
jgi:hypothetical protein